MSLFIHHTNSLTIKCSKYLLMCKSSTYFAVRNAAHFLVANRLMLMRLDEDTAITFSDSLLFILFGLA